ncbi:MAG: M23 family metallopeptidase [Tenericutes bacterium]|nr:M23 family metallopeptidase [Mycoplasmatota bacterium]
MTYEEYKNNKKGSSTKLLFKSFMNKLFTIVIFTMLIIIISNYSPKFRNFIIDKVLNNTIDFSFVNKFMNKTTDIFSKNNTENVFKEETKHEKYKDGIKYIIGEGENIYLKDSGIVTFIGNKDGYNNTIIVQQSNGYYAWYGNVKESVKLYDYIEKGEVIGTGDNEYYYVLLKDNKPVNIDEN